MIKAIIFDYNKTMYLPDLKEIPTETFELLKRLRYSGIILGLISSRAPKRREQFEKFCLYTYFDFIKIVDKKKISDFRASLKYFKVKKSEMLVVGDRLEEEIKLANILGIKSVWIRHGKMKSIKEIERPTWVINSVLEIENLFLKANQKIYIQN